MEYKFAFDISTSMILGKHGDWMLSEERITLGL